MFGTINAKESALLATESTGPINKLSAATLRAICTTFHEDSVYHTVFYTKTLDLVQLVAHITADPQQKILPPL
jgi:hypothetical protein